MSIRNPLKVQQSTVGGKQQRRVPEIVFPKKLVGGEQLHTLRQLNWLFLWHRFVAHRLIDLQLLTTRHNTPLPPEASLMTGFILGQAGLPRSTTHNNRDVTEPANIRICRMQISCAKSVRCRFVAQSKLPAIIATVIQLLYLKLSSCKRTSSEQLK